MESFDKKYGTYHKTYTDTNREREKEQHYAAARNDYEEFFIVKNYEIGKMYVVLHISIEKIEEILQKLAVK